MGAMSVVPRCGSLRALLLGASVLGLVLGSATAMARGFDHGGGDSRGGFRAERPDRGDKGDRAFHGARATAADTRARPPSDRAL